MFLQTENCAFSDPTSLEWSIPETPVPKPPVILPVTPPEGSPTIKVLHLADVHWDPEYLEGTNAVCGEPLCCRASAPNDTLPGNEAGYWGNYGVCDLPWRTVEKAVVHMSQQHPDADYIVWTGDLVPHDVWSTEKAENLYIIDRLMTLMKTYFPNTPLYPTLGNHESSPFNVFSPPEVIDPEFSNAWLYDEAARQWASWLPAEVSETIRYGGYYTTLAKPGLRIVSMNMNYCYNLNLWTLSVSQDPASGLLWLSQVLEQAEAANEKVHILSHIPPGNSDCWTIFSREYVKLINRYESTVAAQFFGHTHAEEIKIFYETTGTESRATNVAFIGGSLTTYDGINPGYRVYTVDGERPNSSFAVLDYITWYTNLTEANANPDRDPLWETLYAARAEYGLSDLSPSSVDAFVNRLATDQALYDLYLRNFNKGSGTGTSGECDAACKAEMLCSIVTADFGDQSHCVALKQRASEHMEF